MDTKTYTPESFVKKTDPCDDYSIERVEKLLGKEFDIFDIILNNEIEPLDIFHHIIDEMLEWEEKKEFKDGIVFNSGLFFDDSFFVIDDFASDETHFIYKVLKKKYTNKQIEDIIFYYRELLYSYMLAQGVEL